MKLFPIFSRRLARELEKLGFEVKQIAPNRNNSNLLVYYFEETVALHNTVQQLLQSKN